jgi:hypothetical protein
MNTEELECIRSWDKRCGDNEETFFPVTKDRRRLLEYVDELRAELAALNEHARSLCRPMQTDVDHCGNAVLK